MRSIGGMNSRFCSRRAAVGCPVPVAGARRARGAPMTMTNCRSHPGKPTNRLPDSKSNCPRIITKSSR